MRMMTMKGRGKRTRATSSSSGEEVEEENVIRKGPWKAEEDEVLLKHVHKYGPRDWSSLRSKGLLQRTGKSCRLRWVNKLRPNLKNGCKFSAEEERIVIELQAQLGNKWAKIATYLPGRTDNDVKNFWSSRQKRLARLLLNSQQQNSKSKPNKALTDLISLPSEAQNHNLLVEESLTKPERSSSSQYTSGVMEMVPLHTLIEPNNALELPLNNTGTTQAVSSSLSLIPMDQQNLSFPEPSSDFQLLSPNAQEDLIRNLDLDFMGAVGRADNPVTSGVLAGDDDDHGLMELSSEMAFLGPTGFSHQQLGGEIKPGEVGGGGDDLLDQNPLTPANFFDDLPFDIFDQMEPLPSPPTDR